jgi:hypothetical protein
MSGIGIGDGPLGEGLTRRTFVALGGSAALTLAGAGVLTAAARAQAVAGARIWSRATYLPLVGQSFGVSGYKGSLVLTAVRDLPFRPVGSDDAFSLTFSASAGALADGLPELHRPGVGSFAMFLAPGEASGSGWSYSAVIDRTYG